MPTFLIYGNRPAHSSSCPWMIPTSVPGIGSPPSRDSAPRAGDGEFAQRWDGRGERGEQDGADQPVLSDELAAPPGQLGVGARGAVAVGVEIVLGEFL